MEVSAPALVIKPWRAAPHAAPVGGLPVDNPLRVSAGGSHARLPHARLPVRRCMKVAVVDNVTSGSTSQHRLRWDRCGACAWG